MSYVQMKGWWVIYGGAQEPEWLHCSHSAVHDGEWGSAGVPTEVYYHLHCFEHVKLQVVVTAPNSQLLSK